MINFTLNPLGAFVSENPITAAIILASGGILMIGLSVLFSYAVRARSRPGMLITGILLAVALIVYVVVFIIFFFV